MPAGSTARASETEVPTFEVERFAWAAADRLEVEGRWFGVRGRRFMRPTLDLRGAGGRRRLLALLEHKPWAAEDGRPWVAAFTWEGEGVAVDGADLAVAPGIEVALPAPSGPGAAASASRARTAPGRPGAAAAEPPAGDRDALLQRLGALKSERDEALAAHEATLRDLHALRRRAALRPDDLEALRAERDAARSASDEAGARLEAAREELDRTRGALERTRAERDNAAAARDAALRGRDEAARRLETLRAERDEALAAHAAARREAERLEAERLDDDRPAGAAWDGDDEAGALRARVERERDAALGERDVAVAERGAAQDDLGVARRELEAVAAERDELRDALEAARAPQRQVHGRPRPPSGEAAPPTAPAPRTGTGDTAALDRADRRAARAARQLRGGAPEATPVEVWLARVLACGALAGILVLVVLVLQAVV